MYVLTSLFISNLLDGVADGRLLVLQGRQQLRQHEGALTPPAPGIQAEEETADGEFPFKKPVFKTGT